MRGYLFIASATFLWGVSASLGRAPFDFAADFVDLAGGSVSFSFSCSDGPGLMTAGLEAVDSQTNTTAAVTADTIGPAAPNGPAVPAVYSTNANQSLNIAAANGVLANDIGSGLSVTSADSASAWGVPVQVSANGSFTWTPGSRFIGLSWVNSCSQ